MTTGKRSTWFRWLLIFWALLAVRAGLAQNLLTDGSFESDLFQNTNGSLFLPAGSLDLSEWRVLGGVDGSIQWMFSNNVPGFLPFNGARFLNLVGTPAGADGAGIQLATPLAVVPGQYYQITFALGTTSRDHWLYTDPAGLRGPGVQLSISGASPGNLFFFGDTSLADDAGNAHWTRETTGPIEATGYWLQLAFTSIGYGNETLVGLDDVQVVPAPEPSSFVIAVLGSVLWYGRSRRRARPPAVGRGRVSQPIRR